LYNRTRKQRRQQGCCTPERKQEAIIEPRELANTLMDLVGGKKATHVTLLDLRGVSIIADYFLICGGESARQLKAIAGEVQEKLGAQQVSPRRVEGTPDSGWILMDFGSVILHIFDQTQRDYYQLEEVWKHARTLAVMP
jgi:ribosome-associated protein